MLCSFWAWQLWYPLLQHWGWCFSLWEGMQAGMDCGIFSKDHKCIWEGSRHELLCERAAVSQDIMSQAAGEEKTCQALVWMKPWGRDGLLAVYEDKAFRKEINTKVEMVSGKQEDVRVALGMSFLSEVIHLPILFQLLFKTSN